MKTSHLENQTLNVNATMSNTDKQGLHRSSVEEVEISEETMRTISNQPFIYQSHVNPKVQVTLEFSEQSNCEDGEKEVKNIFVKINITIFFADLQLKKNKAVRKPCSVYR